MMHVSIITGGGKRVQLVDDQWDIADNADYYILWKDRHKFAEKADMLLHWEKEKHITQGIAKELVMHKLLWPAK